MIGVPIRNAAGEPVGALSCGAIKERLEGARRNRIVMLLTAEAESISNQLPKYVSMRKEL